MTTWISVLIAVCEHVIKQVREKNGKEGEHITGFSKLPFLKDKVYLTKYHNYGAFLNLGSKHPEFIKGLSVGLCILCCLLYVFSFGKESNYCVQDLLFCLGELFPIPMTG